MSELEVKTLEALLKIEAGQGALHSSIGELKSEAERTRGSISRIERETTLGFGEVREGMAVMVERLNGHIRDDDRRFGEQEKQLSRAHEKLARRHRENDDDGGSNLKRNSAIAAFVAGVTGFVTWLVDVLSSAPPRGGH